MHVEPLEWAKDPAEPLTEMFRFCDPAANTVIVGTGTFRAGQQMPPSGYSEHAMREISFILEGELETECDGRTERMAAGDIITIPPGRRQRTVFLKDTRLVYLFFGHPGYCDGDPDS